MTANCTAPIEGHRVPGSAANCPVHAPRRPVRAGDLPRPPLRAASLTHAMVEEMTENEQIRLAMEEDTPPEALDWMTGSEWLGVILEVGSNPSTPPATLTRLAADDDFAVRVAVARNKAVPLDMLERLAGDADEDVREAVVTNDLATAQILNDLSERGPVRVRRLAARHANVADATLLALAQSNVVDVQRAAAHSIDERIAMRCGVNAENTSAIEALREQAWWEMTPESPEVAVSLALFPDT